MTQRTVFFVSDHSGVTAETLGQSLTTQFDTLEFRNITLPFVSTVDKARRAGRKINAEARKQGAPAIVFSTLVNEDVRDTLREIVGRTDALFLDFFDSFLAPLEQELGHKSQHALGVSHGIRNYQDYDRRIEAMNFALAHGRRLESDRVRRGGHRPGGRVALREDPDLPLSGAPTTASSPPTVR